MRRAAVWLVVIVLWLGATYAIGEAAGLLDGRDTCEPPTCQVSPQDAGQPH